MSTGTVSSRGVVTSARDMPRRAVSRAMRSRRWAGMLFTLPALALVAWVIVVPLVEGLYYSFTDWDGGTATWVGLDNYLRVISVPDLLVAVQNSLLILLSVPIGLIGPFLVAYLLSGGLRGAPLLRTLIFAPTALSWVVIGVVSRSILADSGPLNAVLGSVGLGSLAENWLADPGFAIWAVVLAFNAAVFGSNTVIFLAGFATLDRSMIEAARVDGASAGRTLWSIILPNMLRFVQFVYITTVITSFTGLFGLIYTMTAGGPGHSSTTLEFSVWQNAFTSGDFGLSAAMGIFLLIGVIAILATSRFLSRRSDEGLER